MEYKYKNCHHKFGTDNDIAYEVYITSVVYFASEK